MPDSNRLTVGCLFAGTHREISPGSLGYRPLRLSLIHIFTSAVVALTQFGSLEKSLLVASTCIGLHIISGNIITPYLTSRASRLSTIVVFLGVLAWGWLWGVWGLLLGTPILMSMKAVFDRVDDLKAVGDLLGRSENVKTDVPIHGP